MNSRPLWHEIRLAGNKTTGFVVGILFFELNGPRLTATEDDAIQLILDPVARVTEDAEYVCWLENHSIGTSM